MTIVTGPFRCPFARLVPSLLTGAAVLGMVVLGEPATAARIFFVCLLLGAVVGLKATSGH
ncbi:multidrug transporter EmrE-like cation transporter [Streptomyces canus]|uniref:hypothetical protein n=1 Tax=Streptomyces canus TaxID=58343 RepID=UPI00278B68E0|nr:hypothetical protein [Streptomyces canus]MDQ0601436.1 multidrug transporter EmrE-like cation transporter [Streptomyces canus]